jgi:protein AATF/BFR2
MPHHLHKSVVQFIDETLADYDKVLGRTRVRRGKGSGGRINAVSGKDGAGEETDAGLFDDTDFYQQLLRDVIDARGNRVGGGDDWMTSQKQKKAKQVDTKASKGRKLR